MRWLKIGLLGCALGLLLTLAVSSFWLLTARERGVSPFKLSAESTREKLVQVVGSQLAALRKGDFTRAYDHAATGLKARMTPDAFARMVRNAYPAIANSQQVGFGMIFDNGDFALVNVAVMGQAGDVVHYQYMLHREKTGWKITGVSRARVGGTAI
jgi:Domain of unknown function (DUF4864)